MKTKIISVLVVSALFTGVYFLNKDEKKVVVEETFLSEVITGTTSLLKEENDIEIQVENNLNNKEINLIFEDSEDDEENENTLDRELSKSEINEIKKYKGMQTQKTIFSELSDYEKLKMENSRKATEEAEKKYPSQLLLKDITQKGISRNIITFKREKETIEVFINSFEKNEFSDELKFKVSYPIIVGKTTYEFKLIKRLKINDDLKQIVFKIDIQNDKFNNEILKELSKLNFVEKIKI